MAALLNNCSESTSAPHLTFVWPQTKGNLQFAICILQKMPVKMRWHVVCAGATAANAPDATKREGNLISGVANCMLGLQLQLPLTSSNCATNWGA